MFFFWGIRDRYKSDFFGGKNFVCVKFGKDSRLLGALFYIFMIKRCVCVFRGNKFFKYVRVSVLYLIVM